MFDFTLKEKNSIVIETLSVFFYIIRFFSPFHAYYVIKKRFWGSKDNRRRVELYVFVGFIGSFILSFLWPAIPCPELKLLIVVLAMLRIIETIVVQINALLFDWYRRGKEKKAAFWTDRYVIRGYLRITLLLIANFAEIIFWFSIFYQYFAWAFNGLDLFNPVFTLNFSFYTMTTFGHVIIENNFEIFGYALTLAQAIIGLFMVLLILSRFISLFPKPPSDDEVEKFLEEESKKPVI